MSPLQGGAPAQETWDVPVAEVGDPRSSCLCDCWSEAEADLGHQYLCCKLQLLFLELVDFITMLQEQNIGTWNRDTWGHPEQGKKWD